MSERPQKEQGLVIAIGQDRRERQADAGLVRLIQDNLGAVPERARGGLDAMANGLREDYIKLYAAGVLRDLRDIVFRRGEDGKLALTFRSNALELVAAADGTTVATVNNIELLNDRTPGDEFVIIHDGAWIQAIYDLDAQARAREEAAQRRAQIIAAETMQRELKPY